MAVLIYAAIVLTRPLNTLSALDLTTVNPPGAGGRIVAAVRFIYFLLVPALYAMNGILLLAGWRKLRVLFAVAVALELIVCGAYLYIASEIDMLALEPVSQWWRLGAYFLLPLALLAAVMVVTRDR